ncbi:DUF262 domain-containing protein [Dysgonomonas termitidis]|uniref:DUF262 domain-containing protein n=1 Tax=Dysgonomonas termitidis TaxID=1516126 RepID=A0ABV9L3U7_9BACT
MAITPRNEIKTDKIYIKDVFEQWYRIPEYQRPYVWSKDEVIELLDDISYASVNTPSNDYFLGSFVYQHRKAGGEQEFIENDLLDGQQRITTIFLLFAVVRDIETNKIRKENCQKYIFQEEDKDTNTPERIRLLYKIRSEVEKFIDEYVKPENSIIDKWEDIKRIAIEDKDVSIKNMANAIVSIRTYFEDNKNIDTFFPYLLQYVLMIYVYSEQLEDAFRLFTILNDRGVKLRNSDILKAQNLQYVPDSERTKYGLQWEELESELGEEFDRFLSFIRTIVVKEKARLNLLQEFEDKIYNPKEKDKTTGKLKPALLKRGKETFDLLNKYYDHYDQLFENDNYNFTNGFEFNNMVVVMKTTLPSTDWIPPLLSYYNKFNSNRIYDFLLLLDKKFTGDWIGQLTPTERIENMNAILKGIESHKSPDDLFKTNLFDFDKVSLLKNISQKAYGRQFVKNILLKLDFLYNDNKVNKWSWFGQITIEHILPQNPKDGSQWKKDFTDTDRADLTNKIGNLILLGRGKNASQGRFDYSLKHQKYFAENINTFPNSLRVFNKYRTQWTKNELNENQKYVLDTLKAYYNIE